MHHTINDITQTTRRAKNNSIETSQNWSTQTINHWNGKKEDEKFDGVIQFHSIDNLQAYMKKWTCEERMVWERGGDDCGWKGKRKWVVTKQPTNAWWQITRFSCHPFSVVQQRVDMCGECHLWWMAKRHICGWQSHATNHKYHQSPSTTTHTPMVTNATSHTSIHTHHDARTWLDGGAKTGWPHSDDQHTMDSWQPLTLHTPLRCSTPSSDTSLLPSSWWCTGPHSCHSAPPVAWKAWCCACHVFSFHSFHSCPPLCPLSLTLCVESIHQITSVCFFECQLTACQP